MNNLFYLCFALIFLSGCTGTPSNEENSRISFVSEYELWGKSPEELRIIRNEVYARKGYIFKSEDLNTHFKKSDWYDPKYYETKGLLSETELVYVNMILKIEENLKKKPSFKYEISEDYLKSYKTDTLNRVRKIISPKFSNRDREDQYTIVKQKAEYYALDMYKLNDSVTVKLVSAEWDQRMFDGLMKFIFVATYDKELNQIDNVRVGKLAWVSDYLVTEESVLNVTSISRKTEVNTIDENGKGIIKKEKSFFEIQENGTISEIKSR
ncbi:MAG: YARHG domain-containing protein [Ekhidna sp.]|nr:YARHG domain-containing protein [Ekhidna sp.]